MTYGMPKTSFCKNTMSWQNIFILMADYKLSSSSSKKSKKSKKKTRTDTRTETYTITDGDVAIYTTVDGRPVTITTEITD